MELLSEVRLCLVPTGAGNPLADDKQAARGLDYGSCVPVARQVPCIIKQIATPWHLNSYS